MANLKCDNGCGKDKLGGDDIVILCRECASKIDNTRLKSEILSVTMELCKYSHGIHLEEDVALIQGTFEKLKKLCE
jgi:hypothetical protein